MWRLRFIDKRPSLEYNPSRKKDKNEWFVCEKGVKTGQETAEKACILVVDDEPGIRQTLKDYLGECGYSVLTAGEGEEALSLFQTYPIDLVIADIRMPGELNGLMLTRRIKELNPNTPVIVITGFATIDYAVESMKAGAVDFIAKPLRMNHTIFVIEKALETQRLREMAEMSEYYKRLSNIDEMTGIYNFRFFMQMLQNEMERHTRYPDPLCLLIVDIDDFKQINDRYGHLVGDSVLRRVAILLKRSVRGCDVLARYGGEEFAVILPATALKDAAVVAERIRSTVAEHRFHLPDGLILDRVTVTLGLGAFSNGDNTPDALIRKADQALYEGKKSGKNKVVCDTLQADKSV